MKTLLLLMFTMTSNANPSGTVQYYFGAELIESFKDCSIESLFITERSFPGQILITCSSEPSGEVIADLPARTVVKVNGVKLLCEINDVGLLTTDNFLLRLNCANYLFKDGFESTQSINPYSIKPKRIRNFLPRESPRFPHNAGFILNGWGLSYSLAAPTMTYSGVMPLVF